MYAGDTIQIVSTPTAVVAGWTPQVTLTCTPGDLEDISQIMLMQINHIVNGTKVPVVDITAPSNVQEHDGTRRLNVQGGLGGR